MDIESSLKISGNLSLRLVGEDGRTIRESRHKNLVVTTGKNLLLNRLKENTLAPVSHFALGTGPTVQLVTDVALEAELARVALSIINTNQNSIYFYANIPAGTGTGTITEAGLFNASSDGILFARTTFPAYIKSASTQLIAVWQIILG